MICVEVKSILLASGETFYLSPVQPQPADYTSCVYVIQSANEISAWPPLSIEQGTTIAVAVGVCWAAAYAFRVMGQFLKSSSNQGD